MRTQEAKTIHIRDLLSALGCEAVRQVRGEWWYCSPWRQESDASFKISRDGKAWYDHGSGVGGNILKFVCLYYGLAVDDVAGALRKLEALPIARSTSLGDPSLAPVQPSLWEDAHQRAIDARRAAKEGLDRESHPEGADDALTVLRILPLQSLGLIQYLKERGIDKAIAMPWLQEMHYQRGDRRFYSLAFASRSGGYELRSRGFKSAQGKKDLTLLSPQHATASIPDAVAMFEGFMDFLSWMQHRGSRTLPMPVIILNSASLRKRAVETIQEMGVGEVHLYLDHDDTGKELVSYLQEKLPDLTLIDQSPLYASFHDYNAFLIQNRLAACIA
ncbi:MAG: toprim domain-containing protein [Chloroflexota bacterium]